MTGRDRPRPGKVPPGEPVVWPADWGPRFTIFVDVEEEFDWSAPFAVTGWTTAAMPALRPFAAMLAGRGIGVTYLADYPVVTEPRAAEVLRQVAALPGAEIGTQLHPWVNPPHDEALSAPASYAGNLPAALEAAKLDALTAAIERAIGTRPRAYRAGRYGIGPNTCGLLADRGYRLDTSVRTGFDYRADGGPDFRDRGAQAHHLPGGLIELPLTTVYTGRLRRGGPGLYRTAAALPRGPGLLAHAGLLSRVPLTPEGVPVREAIEAIRVAVGESIAVLNLSFHSPSLVPGHTPYVRDAADLARFHGWWDAVLALLDRLGVRPASLAQLLAAACGPAARSATPPAGVGL